MTYKEYNAFCRELPATTHVVQWGGAHVWKVGGKVFAIGGWHEDHPAFTFKVNEIAWDENKKLVGRRVELMVAEGEGRKDAATHRLSGRGPDNRLVHFAPPVDVAVRPGDMVTVEITYAAPHHLVADTVISVRRTRSGDAWEARQGRPAGEPGASGTRTVGLGLPSIGVPAPLPDAPVCG